MSQKKSLDKYLMKLLNKYYFLADNHPEKRNIHIELCQKLYSPALIVSCDFIAAGNRLMREALIVSDAFDSLTNGIIDEPAIEKLESISEDSLLYPWCILSKAVHSFYTADYNNCLDYIRRVPEDSAPGLFKLFFESILDNNLKIKSAIKSDEHWQSLNNSILERPEVIEDALRLIQESVEMEDLLLESAGLLIKDIIKDHRESAQKIILWCFSKLQLKDVLSDRAIFKARQLFGEEDAYRLSAIASLSFDPDRSLVYWLHSILAYLNGHDTNIMTVKSYLSILRDISETVELEFDLSEEYIQLIDSLVVELWERIGLIYPEIPIAREPDTNPFTVISEICAPKQQISMQRKLRDPQQVPVQLELFA